MLFQCIGLTGAGKATEERNRNVQERAMVHKEKLKSQGDMLQSKYGTMSETVVQQLKEINYIVLDSIMNSDQFKLYLKNIFDTLGTYSGK